LRSGSFSICYAFLFFCGLRETRLPKLDFINMLR
jgi:hypothetical protein